MTMSSFEQKHNQNLRLSFSISPKSSFYLARTEGQDALRIRITDGELICEIFSTFSDIPLTLRAPCTGGDRADLILMPHRIELWTNGTLRDEEWPAGDLLYTEGLPAEGALQVTARPYADRKEPLPAVLSSFENAEGWHPEENIYVGDCMPYTADGRYHVLYLKDRRHHKSKWKLGAHQWEHISTADFVHWNIHPTAVEITEPWEGSICTGSHIRFGETDYLFYTVRMADRSSARIMRSISTDGVHFSKDPAFCFTVSKKYDGPSARDPKIIRAEDGVFHMLLTTSLTEENRGCLAHLVSRDLDAWEECDEPIYVSDNDTQPECPDYICYAGKYYLIFSLHGKAHYLLSDRPFDGFFAPNNPIIPCESVPKGAVWNGKIIFTGFRGMGGYAGAMTFRTATANENGTLLFE